MAEDQQNRDPNDLSDQLYKVDRGTHVDAEGKRLTAGETFHPTNRQVATGSLRGKASPVAGSEPRRSVRGADIGIRALEWGSDVALRKAVKNDVTVEELEAAGGPTGETGYVTADVNRALAAREKEEKEGGGEDAGSEESSDEGEEGGDGGEGEDAEE